MVANPVKRLSVNLSAISTMLNFNFKVLKLKVWLEQAAGISSWYLKQPSGWGRWWRTILLNSRRQDMRKMS